ncbi:DUF1761 family protein [Aestuariivivens sediminicola]|uniref:DUF1761 family protein n=1 Tax=Aestuariivivens sediminicola TaxID=2913560 RepID=UPI001F592986|nr:DUF1761 family protein [Aestuariivivens sediminicola]
MKTKNFLAAGIAGGIVDFLLGWLFYGILFKDSFDQPEENSQAMLFIFLGCLTFGLFLAYIFGQWAQISTASTGAKAGAIIGLFMGLLFNFFHIAMHADASYQVAALDVAISVVMAAIVGAVVGFVNGKMG